MKVEVNTRQYEFSHGRKPRGADRWFFWMGSDTRDILKARWFDGKYSEAKKKAQAMARELGYETVTVGS